MAKLKAGYGIKVETDTGHKIWLTEDSTTNKRAEAMTFDSEAGADTCRNVLAKKNPHAVLTTEKFSK